MSRFQNISHFFSTTTMTSDMDIFRHPVYRKITFFLVFGSQLFCSTFAQNFFGLKLTPEIIVIEIISAYLGKIYKFVKKKNKYGLLTGILTTKMAADANLRHAGMHC